MEEIQKEFVRNGWIVVDFPDSSAVLRTREALNKQLCELIGKETSLEEYHQYFADDQAHTKMQVAMTEFYRQKKFCFDIVSSALPILTKIVGPDVSMQANPYLRMARPHKKQDNIGYHRDTHYGGAPYELSFFVPFVDLKRENCLGVVSGTHIHAEERYPTTQILNPDKEVVKGSPKHQLGFLYAPKVMDQSIEEEIEPIPLKVGQALLFALPLVHGCCCNFDAVTRWSSDIRIMNSYAPVEMGTRTPIYAPIARSPISYCAQKYEEANGTRDEVEVELCV
ncbi:MAG: hypothetical protein ACKVOH_05140 [Chlamydiales bacterium]